MKKLPLYAAALASAALGIFAVAPANADPLAGIANGALVIKIGGAATTSDVWSGTDEAAWDVGTVTSVKNNDTGQIWGEGNGGVYLNYMLYGIANASGYPGTDNSIGATNTGASGPADGYIHLDIYSTTTAANFSAGPDGRTAYNEYTGVTGDASELYLSLVLVPGCLTGDTTVTLCETLPDFSNNPPKGSGQFYAEVTGGSAEYEFDSNKYVGGAADIKAVFDYEVASTLFDPPSGDAPGMCSYNTTAHPTPSPCFEFAVNDPISATKVPEPSSLSIMGGALALMGAATWLRRHRKAQGTA